MYLERDKSTGEQIKTIWHQLRMRRVKIEKKKTSTDV
jgi:hypothetical protein